MGVRITSNVDQNFDIFLKRGEGQLYDALADAVEEIVRQGALTARALTAQRGRPTSQGGGRVETGAMAEALKHKVEASARKIVGEFGFTDGHADYYIYQTVTGFNHWLSSEFIAPTFAIRDAGEIARGEMAAAIKAAIRKVRW